MLFRIITEENNNKKKEKQDINYLKTILLNIDSDIIINHFDLQIEHSKLSIYYYF